LTSFDDTNSPDIDRERARKISKKYYDNAPQKQNQAGCFPTIKWAAVLFAPVYLAQNATCYAMWSACISDIEVKSFQ